jgi:elongation factor G
MSAQTYATDKIRNVAIVGHSDTGKTTLVSALLFNTGIVNRLCKVDDGNTATDFDDDEIERKITINTAVAHLDHNGTKINLIDTPGYSIYTTEAMQGLRVADTALLMISAVGGIEVQTEKMWKAAQQNDLPVIFCINLMDRDRASFQRTLDALQKKYGRDVVPLQLPIGEEGSFKGVVDLISGIASTWSDDESGAHSTCDVPGDLADAVSEAREALMEMVAEQDEELMEAYLESGELDVDTMKKGLASAIRSRGLFPVFSMAAGKNIGTQGILDGLVDLVPSPDWRPVPARTESGEELELTVDTGEPAAAYVFKTFSDPYTGRITLFRLFTGSIKTDVTIANPNRDSNERLGSLSVMQGKELEHISELAAGDIGAVPKLKETHTCDTLCDSSRSVFVAPVPIPESAISFALTPKAKGDEDKLATALVKIRDEDPTIKYGRDPQTKELLISGAGQLHVEVVVAKLKKRYKVDVVLQQPKVPYRETITASTEATARHKKQSGGHGQFAECKVIMEPLEPNSGYQFVDKIFGGSISQGYRPAVDKGIQEAAEKGFLSGNPVVDFRVILIDGKEHSVDSSEMAFKIAGRKVFKECMKSAKPTLLEPIMQVEVYTPEELMGDVMGDLNSRRGKVQGMDSEDGSTVIRAAVPLSEMLSYSPTLRSITGGRGDYHMEFKCYEEVPKQLQEKIIAEAIRVEEEDED